MFNDQVAREQTQPWNVWIPWGINLSFLFIPSGSGLPIMFRIVRIATSAHAVHGCKAHVDMRQMAQAGGSSSVPLQVQRTPLWRQNSEKKIRRRPSWTVADISRFFSLEWAFDCIWSGRLNGELHAGGPRRHLLGRVASAVVRAFYVRTTATQ